MKKKISYTSHFPMYALSLMSFFPLLNIKGVSISVILCLLLSVIYFAVNFRGNWKPDLKSLLITSTPFVLYLLGMIYTDDFKEGIKVLETGLPLLIFPFIYFILLGKNYFISLKNINKVQNLLVLSSSLLITIVLFYIVITGVWTDLFDDEIMLKASRNQGKNMIREAIQQIPFLGEHPTYFGLLSVITFIISIFRIAFDKKYIFVISLVLGFLGILVSGSKMAILSFLVSIFLIAILKIRKKRNIVIFIFLTILVSTLLVKNNSFLKNRFKEIIITKLEAPRGTNYNSTNVRLAILQCSLGTFSTAPILGQGTGGYKLDMVECFKNFDTDIFERHQYYFNTHNQYFSFALYFGVIGLLVFLLWLGAFAKVFLKNREVLFLVFLLVFLLMFLTENILERQTGVILFSILMPLYYKYSLQLNEK